MKTLIKDITNIQTGLFAKPAGIGELVYLQSKHFDEYGQLHSVLHPDLPAEGISEKHLLKDGDVLFAAKGTKNFAAVFENNNEPSVASTSFFVIRPTSNKVLPKFLAWFLNNHSTQTLLKGQAIGTSIPSISKQVLENLEITIPSIETQLAILQITQLRNREKSLKLKIEMLREKQIQQQIINAIK
ncbi:Type I restriction modification DNA specificity domain-containing protein [Paenimyroides aquimaris]|uniref:Type I restriction modification DNA specificity domain-containing protein n=1 Tax=Paenimyroides marinum TaxID=1159016 RepID=A0A1H6MJR6_9FLAO|nr:restriction endonuclease subunit S [Paenimyroides aquimaris]SEH99443.1 Type I restriction modification DNA specificity domain-containing protein [Paenimyroides aquimaris]